MVYQADQTQAKHVKKDTQAQAKHVSEDTDQGGNTIVPSRYLCNQGADGISWMLSDQDRSAPCALHGACYLNDSVSVAIIHRYRITPTRRQGCTYSNAETRTVMRASKSIRARYLVTNEYKLDQTFSRGVSLTVSYIRSRLSEYGARETGHGKNSRTGAGPETLSG